MIYDFKCKTCHKIEEVVRDVESRDFSHQCKCGSESERIFTPTKNITPGAAAFKAGRYHAFGKNFETKTQLNNEIKRIKGETGKNIVELGNDSSTYKPKRKEYDWNAIGKELHKGLYGK